jgi:type IV pilus assembly protein PilW
MATHNFKQQGMSLIELMVALALSAFLLTGVTQVFVKNQQSNRLQNSFSRVQESGRLALELLERDIRMADFWGCMRDRDPANIQNNLDQGSASYDPNIIPNRFASKGIEGQDDVAAGTLSADGVTEIKGGTDSITLTGASGAGSIKVEPPYMPTPAGALQVTPGNGLAQGDVVMVADCSGKADVFEVTTMNPDSNGTVGHNTGIANPIGNSNKNFSHSYEGDASIISPVSTQYFIGTRAGAGYSSLYRSTNGGTAVELVPYVDNMQILYGEDQTDDGFVERYSEADVVADMDQVKTVRIQLLIEGQDDVGLNSQVSFNGVPQPVDGQMRRIYATTVAVRNRLL